ncbi:hypothetical protein BGX24_005066, partial [Mortierella sp. AD032]
MVITVTITITIMDTMATTVVKGTTGTTTRDPTTKDQSQILPVEIDHIAGVQIDLVCDNAVIDSIACLPPKAVANPDGTPYYEKTNLCNKADCKTIIAAQFIKLNAPCSPNPAECAAALGNEYPTDTDETFTEEENKDDDDESDADNKEPVLDAAAFQDLNNDGHHHHRHHHKKLGRHQHHKKGGQNHHYHYKGPHRHKSKHHPWDGLCTSVGAVCGSELFGCDFIPSALYQCDQVTGIPAYVGNCADGCSGGGICAGLTTPKTGTTTGGGDWTTSDDELTTSDARCTSDGGGTTSVDGTTGGETTTTSGGDTTATGGEGTTTGGEDTTTTGGEGTTTTGGEDTTTTGGE